jgi:hypothetical protein
VTDVTYEAECEVCGITNTVKAIRATTWKESYDAPCGNCGNMLLMQKIKVEESA